MADDDALHEFLDALQGPHPEPPSVEGSLIQMAVPDTSELELFNAPPDYALVLTEVGRDVDEITLKFDQKTQPKTIRVVAGAQLRHLSFVLQPEPLSLLELELHGAGQVVNVSDFQAERLEVQGGRARLTVRPERVRRLSLVDAILDGEERFSIERLRLGGSVGITGPNIRAEMTYVLPDLELFNTGGLSLGRVVSGGGDPREGVELVLKGTSDLAVKSFTEGSSVKVGGGELILGEDSADTTRQLTLSGRGRLSLNGVCEQMRVLREDDGEFVLRIAGSAIEAEGGASVDLLDGAFLSGRPDHPFVLWGVIDAEHAEVENVDVYSLQIHDVARLKGVERFAPSIPRPSQARVREDAMQLGGVTKGWFAGSVHTSGRVW